MSVCACLCIFHLIDIGTVSIDFYRRLSVSLALFTFYIQLLATAREKKTNNLLCRNCLLQIYEKKYPYTFQ